MEDSEPDEGAGEDTIGSQDISLTGALAVGLDLESFQNPAVDAHSLVHLVFCPLFVDDVVCSNRRTTSSAARSPTQSFRPTRIASWNAELPLIGSETKVHFS